MHQPKRVVKDSAASRNSLVDMALSLAASTGTSTNDFFKVSSQVWPGGMTGADMIAKNKIKSIDDCHRKRREKEEGGFRGAKLRSGGNLSSMAIQASTDVVPHHQRGYGTTAGHKHKHGTAYGTPQRPAASGVTCKAIEEATVAFSCQDCSRTLARSFDLVRSQR